MCLGGDDAPEAPVIPKAPPPEEFKDFFNYVSGVKAVEVVGSNGKKHTEVVRIPRKPEQEAFFNNLESQLRGAIATTKDIIAQDPAALPQFMPFIGTLGRLNQETVGDLNAIAGLQGVEQDVQHFRDISERYLNERFDQRREALENQLAHRGLSDSTEGDKARKALQDEFNKASGDNDWNALQYGENLASQKFNNRMAGFNARQIGRQAQASTAEAQLNLERQHYADVQGERAAKIREQGQLAESANTLLNQDHQKATGANVEGHALNRYSAENQVQLAHYNANADRIYKNHNMELGEFNANNSAPSFLSTVTNVGAQLGAAYLTGGGSLFASAGASAGAGIGAHVINKARQSAFGV